MTATPLRWINFLLVPGYVVLANIALASQSHLVASAATLVLVMLLVLAVRSPRLLWLRILMAAGGFWLVSAVARGRLPPLAILLPPVIVPAALAWMFGHTLIGNRIALVERFARALHAPDLLDDAHAAYARSVTVMWTAVLVLMALANLYLVACVTPGGLLQELGVPARWPVSVNTFLWVSNGAYVLVGVLLAAEFAFRRWHLAAYDLGDPLVFMRRARERLPAVIEDLRRG